MRIDSATSGLANLTGSYSGSFTGDGSGLTDLSGIGYTAILWPSGWVSGSEQVDFDLISNKPTLVSASAQIDYTGLTNIPGGIVSASVSGSNQGEINLNGNAVKAKGLASDESPQFESLVLTGDLTVQGTTTTVDSTTVNIADLNITVAKGAASAAAANGGGLTVDGANATLTYANTGDKWVLNKATDVSSLLINGTAVTATATELNQLDGNTVGGTTAGDIVTIDGTQTLTNKTIAASQVTEISNLTAGEGEQLENIGTTTISATQWGYLGATNQGIATSNDVQFDSLGIGTAAPGTTGVIRATNDIIAYYSSDKRLKDNITPLQGALAKVEKLGGYEFDWNSNQEVHEGHDIGVIAQEVEEQYPELVHDRDNGYKAVDYVKLTAVLIEAVKELSEKVRVLESK